jgi:hypothetical protein
MDDDGKSGMTRYAKSAVMAAMNNSMVVSSESITLKSCSKIVIASGSDLHASTGFSCNSIVTDLAPS